MGGWGCGCVLGCVCVFVTGGGGCKKEQKEVLRHAPGGVRERETKKNNPKLNSVRGAGVLLHLSRFINPNINPASSRERKKNTRLVLQIRS